MPTCDFNPDTLNEISKRCVNIFHTARSYNKIFMVETEYIRQIEELHVRCAKIGMDKQNISSVYNQARKDFRESYTHNHFLSLYGERLKQAMRKFSDIKGLSISIAGMMKLDEQVKKKDSYLSRDWIGLNKIKKRK